MTATRGMRSVKLGLNMHPRWLSGGPARAFLSPLRELGVSVLEFRLDLLSPDWPETAALIESCHQLGFGLSFHAPHGGDHTIAGFAGRKGREIKERYAPAIDYVTGVAGRSGPTTIVVHGAKGRGSRHGLQRDTGAFIMWLLEQSADLGVALELRVRERGQVKVGDSKAELAGLVSKLDSERIGICWDLGHDARNGFDGVERSFLSHVKHVHVHDVSPDGRDHCPLVFDNVPYRPCLQRLLRAGYDGSVILEVDGHLVGVLATNQGVTALHMLHQSFRKLVHLTHT